MEILEQIAQYIKPEYIFGFLGGMLATALATSPFKSLLKDIIKVTKLKKWQARACAVFAALIISLSWGLYAGEINWLKLPALTIAYAVFSGVLYEIVKKRFLDKEE